MKSKKKSVAYLKIVNVFYDWKCAICNEYLDSDEDYMNHQCVIWMDEKELIKQLDELDQEVLNVQERIAYIRDRFGLWK